MHTNDKSIKAELHLVRSTSEK